MNSHRSEPSECPHDKVYFFETYTDKFTGTDFVVATCRGCKHRVHLHDHVSAAILNRMAIAGDKGLVA